MSKRPEPLIAFNADGSGVIVTSEPMACRCGRACMIGVNRDGETRCVECDAKHQKEKGQIG
jgi:hypothetical protein